MLLTKEFPSPYGVIFILIKSGYSAGSFDAEFPSPYGVIFILIFKLNNVSNTPSNNKVSVSLRSYIHSYNNK